MTLLQRPTGARVLRAGLKTLLVSVGMMSMVGSFGQQLTFDSRGRLVDGLRPKQAPGTPTFNTTADSASFFLEQGNLVRSNRNITPLGQDLFGDKVNLYTGSLRFSHTDVSVPGNSALPVAVSRSYTAGTERDYDGLFADWDLEIPHLSGRFVGEGAAAPRGWNVQGSLNRCSQYGAPAMVYGPISPNPWEFFEFWGGNSLHLPGGGEEKLLARSPTNTLQPSDGAAYPVVTRSGWQFRCVSGLASPQTTDGTQPYGEGFIGVSPSGVQYLFNWMATRPGRSQHSSRGELKTQEVWLLPTLVTDRFGNTVSYVYDTADPWKLLSINSSDARSISLAYHGGGRLVASVTDGSRTWQYNYATGSNGRSRLVQTILPDGAAWGFDLNESGIAPVYNPLPKCNRQTHVWHPGVVAPAQLESTITHPSGAVGKFHLAYLLHGRSAMSAERYGPCGPGGDEDYYGETPAYAARTLLAKSISGPGIANLNWSFNWSAATTEWYCDTGCVDYKVVTVQDPKGHHTRHIYGTRYRVTEGQLLRTEEGWDGTTAQRTTWYAYRAHDAGTYPAQIGTSYTMTGDSVTETRHQPLKDQTVWQDGVTFSRWGDSFDDEARMTSFTEGGSHGQYRWHQRSYHNSSSPWVRGQVASETIGGITTSSTTFNSLALPETNYQFGLPTVTYSYHGDGTVYTKTDGRNNTTTFTAYHRGLPQQVRYPDQTIEAAAVHHNMGVITARQDRSGAVFTYGYDAAFRLNRISYPGGDPVAWNDTTITFEPVGYDEFGIGAGHWRQTVATGNARNVTYFDALWRPRLTRKFDSYNEAGSNSSTMWNYDAYGRETFESYPQASIGNVNTNPTGVATEYDALGRERRQLADSELGLLTTHTHWLSGFQRQVVNPRGHATTTSFQVFGEPSTTAPTLISMPEGVSVSINRDILGKTNSITRSGSSPHGFSIATRSYVYDQYHRLCKTIEPETGATMVDYDQASNVSWRATGLTLTSSTCDRHNVPTASRTSFQYDSENRLTQTTFGDGSPGISRTYTPDGLPKTINSDGQDWTLFYLKRGLLDTERISVDGWVHDLKHVYDKNGSEERQVHPNGVSIDFEPDALGRPKRIRNTASGAIYASNIVYHPSGALANYTLGNGVSYSMIPNGRGMPYAVQHSNVASNVYTYDQNGNVTGIGDYLISGPDTSRGMLYDGLDRLTVANSPLWGSGGYSYDALDNLRVSAIGSRVATHHFDATTNRLTSYELPGVLNCPFGYDSQGNVSTRCGQGFQFDQGNRLRYAHGLSSYKYDGSGRRTRMFHTDGSQEVQTYSQDGKLVYGSKSSSVYTTTNYVYLGGQLIAQLEKTWTPEGALTPVYVHTDALGSPIAHTNEAGSVIKRMRYEAYGPPWTDAGGALPVGPGFTGHVNDVNTGMVYMQQRYYDPWAGRFLSVDPVVTNPNTGKHFGRYLYAENNPYRFIDPDGRASSEVLCTGESCAETMRELAAQQKRRNRIAWERAVASVDIGGMLEAFSEYEEMPDALPTKIVARSSVLMRAMIDAGLMGNSSSVMAAGASAAIQLGMSGFVGIRNAHLAGAAHPKTGISFDSKGFPDFSGVAIAKVTISQTGTRAGDFRAANKAAGLPRTPENYTWHHHQDGKTMLLVPRSVHSQTGHTGGYSGK